MKNDTIYRQAAIDAADRADYTGLAVEDVKKVTDEVVKELKKLPSTQPEIIHCRECKRHIDGFFCQAANHHTSDKDCCATVFGAERREE